MKQLALFGLPRSGTNYFRDLLRANFANIDADTEGALGMWKHGLCIEPKQPALATIIMTKDPYAWAVSAYHWSQRHPGFTKHDNIKKFLSSKLDISKIGNGSSRSKSITHYNRSIFDNPMHYWSELNAYYITARTCSTKRIVKYEDLLSHPTITLGFVDSLGISRKKGQWKSIDKQSGPSVFHDRGLCVGSSSHSIQRWSKLSHSIHRWSKWAHYNDHLYLDSLTPEGISLVNDTVDSITMASLNYRRVDS